MLYNPQQCGCAAQGESDKPRHQHSIIRVFAVGTPKASERIGAHREDSDQTGHLPSLIRVFTSLVLSSNGSLLISGCLMIYAWIFAASIGIVVARYYKRMWPNDKHCREKVWFTVGNIVSRTLVLDKQKFSA